MPRGVRDVPNRQTPGAAICRECPVPRVRTAGPGTGGGRSVQLSTSMPGARVRRAAQAAMSGETRTSQKGSVTRSDADGETRTPTGFPPLPPQDSVSTSSTTSALRERSSVPARSGEFKGASARQPRHGALLARRFFAPATPTIGDGIAAPGWRRPAGMSSLSRTWVNAWSLRRNHGRVSKAHGAGDAARWAARSSVPAAPHGVWRDAGDIPGQGTACPPDRPGWGSPHYLPVPRRSSACRSGRKAG